MVHGAAAGCVHARRQVGAANGRLARAVAALEEVVEAALALVAARTAAKSGRRAQISCGARAENEV